MTTSDKPYHHGDLRRALLATGEDVLAEVGSANLSLREVARRLGVSHNAPSRHFASREALLAAIALAGLDALTLRLAEAETAGSAAEGMVRRGLAYVAFALERPAVFRLIFSDVIDRAAFPDFAAAAAASLARLKTLIAAAYGPEALPEATLAAWSTVHGLAMLLLDDQATEDLRAGRGNLQLAEATLTALSSAMAGA